METALGNIGAALVVALVLALAIVAWQVWANKRLIDAIAARLSDLALDIMARGAATRKDIKVIERKIHVLSVDVEGLKSRGVANIGIVRDLKETDFKEEKGSPWAQAEADIARDELDKIADDALADVRAKVAAHNVSMNCERERK